MRRNFHELEIGTDPNGAPIVKHRLHLPAQERQHRSTTLLRMDIERQRPGLVIASFLEQRFRLGGVVLKPWAEFLARIRERPAEPPGRHRAIGTIAPTNGALNNGWPV